MVKDCDIYEEDHQQFSTSDRFHVALGILILTSLMYSFLLKKMRTLTSSATTLSQKMTISTLTTVDDEQDTEFQPDGNGVRHGTKEVVQSRFGLIRKNLVEVLENQWNHDSVWAYHKGLPT